MIPLTHQLLPAVETLLFHHEGVTVLHKDRLLRLAGRGASPDSVRVGIWTVDNASADVPIAEVLLSPRQAARLCAVAALQGGKA